MANMFARQSSVMLTSQNMKNLFNQNPTTTLGHLASLNIDDKRTGSVSTRRTTIICTIGPKTNNVEMLCRLREAGMNVVRLNFSHGSFEFHKSIVDNVHKSFSVKGGRTVAIALDTKGPEIRTGQTVNDEEILLEKGKTLILTTDPAHKASGTTEMIYVDYANITKVVKVGHLVYIDDGLISLTVNEIDTAKGTLTCTINNSGKISSRKGINLPNSKVDLPAVSAYDAECFKFGIELGVDMIFASFIRKASDVLEIRRELGEAGAYIKIISKIENNEGVSNFNKILEVSDGIMVARGDLGIEIPPEKVFLAQKMMIARCNIAGKPVICATQMLESMTTNPRPTRAEVSDVANAVLDGADCVMLSGETAKGAYPEETVAMMHKICLEAEAATFSTAFFSELRVVTTPSSVSETLACSAVNAALEQDVGAIVVLTQSGTTARLVSKYRPRCPILSVTRDEVVGRQCHLYRGCYPLIYHTHADTSDWQDDVDARIEWGIKEGARMGLLQPGMLIIAIQGWKSGVGNSNTMRLLTVS